MASSPPEGGFLRNGYPPKLLRQLRRGDWRVEDELDLHGLNRAQLGPVISEFLEDAKARRLQCVRIVHGKGTGVLREALRLALPERAEVLGFVEAPAAQGGSGAVLVLLKA
ncbi:MAG TPA: Smr/MutS family protein [Burkholderiales bacterium]|nr:Smr/MutS family protein [Burkholderiales bacterium]